jgi:hypothetical protein
MLPAAMNLEATPTPISPFSTSTATIEYVNQRTPYNS